MNGVLFLLFAVLQWVDYELTTGILNRGGRELNPVMRAVMNRFGMRGFAAVKVIIVALGFGLAHIDATTALAVLCVVYIGVVVWNWRQPRLFS